MATNKPEVAGFISEVGIKKLREDEYTGDWTLYAGPVRNSVTPLIRLSDHEALQAECEKLRKDAERYRWLRDSASDNSGAAYIGVWHEETGRYVDTYMDREALDAAIDPAMQEGQVMTSHTAETGKMVTLPITTEVRGQAWHLYTFDYMTQDGMFSGYLHALDMGHAEQLLSELKVTAVLSGQMIEGDA